MGVLAEIYHLYGEDLLDDLFPLCPEEWFLDKLIRIVNDHKGLILNTTDMEQCIYDISSTYRVPMPVAVEVYRVILFGLNQMVEAKLAKLENQSIPNPSNSDQNPQAPLLPDMSGRSGACFLFIRA